MSQHLIKEVQQLKHEVAQLKEAQEGGTDMWKAINILITKVEDLELKVRQ